MPPRPRSCARRRTVPARFGASSPSRPGSRRSWSWSRGPGSSPTRRSDLEAPEFRARQTINGTDLARLAQESIELASKTGHMKYRTVSVYPQVDQQLNKAIELVATKQLSAKQAMQQAQAGAIAELKRSGLSL